MLATIREIATPYLFFYVTAILPAAIATAMGSIQEGLGRLVRDISDQNYDQSLACYRLWSEIAQTCSQNHPDQVFDSIYNNRTSSAIDHSSGKLIHPTAHLIFRFASDAESDRILSPQSVGLQSRLCDRILRDFFEKNMAVMQDWHSYVTFYANANFVAHLANLGYVEEAAICDHILQSLISHPTLWYHQASAVIILFKLAGPTFAKYADPGVVDRCFELLDDYRLRYPNNGTDGLILVRVVPHSEIPPSGQPEFLGCNWAAKARVGKSPSSTCTHHQEAKTDGPERPSRNSRRHIFGTSWWKFRTSGPPASAPSTRVGHRPRDAPTSRDYRHPVSVNKHHYSVRFHRPRYLIGS